MKASHPVVSQVGVFCAPLTIAIGTPTGKIQKIGGVEVYVAIPSGEYEKDKALLYIPGDLLPRLGTLLA